MLTIFGINSIHFYTALREVLLHHGFTGGMKKDQSWIEMQNSHAQWIEEVALQLLIVLARDRFGDFVSDQVVAPVRESSAMALGHLVKLMYDPGQVLGMNLDFFKKIRFCQFYQ